MRSTARLLLPGGLTEPWTPPNHASSFREEDDKIDLPHFSSDRLFMSSDPSTTFGFLSVPAFKSLVCFSTSDLFIPYSKNVMVCVCVRKKFYETC